MLTKENKLANGFVFIYFLCRLWSQSSRCMSAPQATLQRSLTVNVKTHAHTRTHTHTHTHTHTPMPLNRSHLNIFLLSQFSFKCYVTAPDSLEVKLTANRFFHKKALFTYLMMERNQIPNLTTKLTTNTTAAFSFLLFLVMLQYPMNNFKFSTTSFIFFFSIVSILWIKNRWISKDIGTFFESTDHLA